MQLKVIAPLLVFTLCSFLDPVRSQGRDPEEVKAVMLSRFCNFIEWPNINDGTEFFVIGVLGEDSFGGYLNSVYENRFIKGKRVKIEYYEIIEGIHSCHILIVSKDKRREWIDLQQSFQDKPIVTIGDLPGMAAKGVMINFFEENNRIGFEFNVDSYKKTNLDVSFRLLEMARIVNSN